MVKTFNHSYHVVYEKCKLALKELEMNISESSSKQKFISASTNGSIFSWGENIDITFEEISDNRTKVIVESQTSAQLFSWGKNSENEGLIIERLSKSLMLR